MTKSSLESDVSVAALMITNGHEALDAMETADTPRPTRRASMNVEDSKFVLFSAVLVFKINVTWRGLSLSLSLSRKSWGSATHAHATLSIHAMPARCMDDKRFALVVKMGH